MYLHTYLPLCIELTKTACIFPYIFQQLQNINSDIIMMVVAASVGMSNLFIYCYFGEMATEYFKRMSNCLYQSEWEALPVELQKYFVVMIANTQIPMFYSGDDLNFCSFLSLSKTL